MNIGCSLGRICEVHQSVLYCNEAQTGRFHVSSESETIMQAGVRAQCLEITTTIVV